MTTPHDPDAMIAAWIDEGPHELPESTRRAIAVTTRTSHQRRRGFGSPWRPFLMTPFARTASAVLILAVGVAGAAYLLAPGSQVGGPSTAAPSSAPPSASASVTASPAELTVVDAAQFAAPFRMTWDVDIRTQVKADVVDVIIRRGSRDNAGGMNIFNVDRVGRDPCTTNELLEQPVQTAQEFMDWLATIPKTTAGPVSTTSIGGRDALERSVSVGSLDGCIDPTALHSGIVSQYGPGPGGYFMGAGEQERWIALELNGRLVVFVVWPAGLPMVAEAAERALATIEFSS
jgi:hypothetical protein